MKVAIQGFKGSYHEIAAYKYFGEREPLSLIECASFPALFQSLNDGKGAVLGVMAIENTVAGTLLPNYLQLLESDMHIIGEVYLRIEHFLLGLSGASLDSLREVHSHPMALLQCLHYFKPHPHIKLVESVDTALSAAELTRNKRSEIGVIASQLAAESFGLQVLARGIETNRRNFTRFLILSAQPNRPDETENESKNPKKVSLNFNLRHETGSLANVLTIFSDCGLDLTKIQSLPVVGAEWQYSFITDVLFDRREQFDRALERVEPFVLKHRILGAYSPGRKYRKI